MLSPELIPIHERLVNIRRQLVALAAKETAREVALVIQCDSYKGKAVATEQDSAGSDPNSRTPTRESTPKPPFDGVKEHKEKDLRVKAELKPIQEELRKIDSLSVFSVHVHVTSVYASCCLSLMRPIHPPSSIGLYAHICYVQKTS